MKVVYVIFLVCYTILLNYLCKKKKRIKWCRREKLRLNFDYCSNSLAARSPKE